MIGRIDPEGAETRVIHDLVDIAGKDVVEVGCGDGRLTWRFAGAAASVLAFDPDEAAIATAREQTPAALRGRVTFRAADMASIDLAAGAYGVGVLSWSI
ncbi:MAG: class I SAM-dependent methyltransferase [Chloroflexi bacterium]|nr:class I SAM-dependent methyltransferase [Chloroflexota bacterium]